MPVNALPGWQKGRKAPLIGRLDLGLGSAIAVLIFLCVCLIAFFFFRFLGASPQRR